MDSSLIQLAVVSVTTIWHPIACAMENQAEPWGQQISIGDVDVAWMVGICERVYYDLFYDRLDWRDVRDCELMDAEQSTHFVWIDQPEVMEKAIDRVVEMGQGS